MANVSSYDALYALIKTRSGNQELTADDYNFQDYEKKSLLYYASRAGDLEAVKALIAKGAEINQLNTVYERSAFEAAVQEGHLEVAEYLYAQGGKLYKLPLSFCEEVTRKWLKEKILAALADTKSKDYSGVPAKHERILHSCGLSIIARIAEVYDAERHQKLVDDIINENRDVNTTKALWYAVINNKNAFIEHVLACKKYNYNPMNNAFSSYHGFLLALKQEKFDLANLFLYINSNVNCENDYRQNGVLIAALNECLPALLYAVQLGIEVTSADIDGNNVLHYLFDWGHRAAHLYIKNILGDDAYQQLYTQKNIHGIRPKDMHEHNEKIAPTSQHINQTIIIINSEIMII